MSLAGLGLSAPLTAWACLFVVLVLTPVVCKLQLITPWLLAAGSWALLTTQGANEVATGFGVILIYLVGMLSQAAESCAGTAVDYQLELGSDTAVTTAPQLRSEWESIKHLGAMGLVLGLGFPLPVPPLFLTGLPALLVLAVLLRSAVQDRAVNDENPRARLEYTWSVVCVCLVLPLAIAAYNYFETPNPLMMLVVISGLSIPRLLSPAKTPPPVGGFAENPNTNWFWYGVSLVTQLAVPGFTSTLGAMIFLQRTWIRPALLYATVMYIEGWNLALLGYGQTNSKTALADLLNRNAPGTLSERSALLIAIGVLAAVITAVYEQSNWFSNPLPPRRTHRYRSIGLLLGQSCAAGGVLWTVVFLVAGGITLRLSRLVAKSNDDGLAAGYMIPMVL